MATILHVCTSCRPAENPGDDPGDTAARPGQDMLAWLSAAIPADAQISLHGANCLSVCKRPCTIAVSAPGKWSYVIGNLEPARDGAALLDYLAQYAAAADGVTPLRQRPAPIRAGIIARLPPAPAQQG